MTLLICEGACNPSLHTFDEVAIDWAAARTREQYGIRSTASSVILAEVIRQREKLRHTPHQHLGMKWACTVCQCERTYGAHSLLEVA